MPRLKKAVKNEATLRSDPTQTARCYDEDQRKSRCFSLHRVSPRWINLRVWDRVPTAVNINCFAIVKKINAHLLFKYALNPKNILQYQRHYS